MPETEWIKIGPVKGDTGTKGDTGDIGIGTIIKGHYNNYSEFIAVHPSGSLGDAYIVEGSYYYWNENGWANAGSVKGDTGPQGEKGDTGNIGTGTVIKGHYDKFEDFITAHPSGSLGDAYIVEGDYYYWDGDNWANAGSLKGDTGPQGEKGDTGDTGPKGATGARGAKGNKGDTGDTGTGTTIKGSYNTYAELIQDHPTGNYEDSYLINGSIYIWNGTEWENGGNIKGEKGDTGDIGIGTVIKGDYDSCKEFLKFHRSGELGEAYIVEGNYYYWNGYYWENAGSVMAGPKGDTGDTGPQGATGAKGAKGNKGDKGDKGDTGTGITIKGSYDTYAELINDHPTGNEGDGYLVDGLLYVWNGSAWENVGNIKGERGATGKSGFSPTVNVDHEIGQIVITTKEGSSVISFDELRGEKGDTGVKGDTGATGKSFEFSDFTPEQLASIKGDTGDTGPKGDAGDGSDKETGWKLPVDKIQTTTTLPTGVSAGYRVAICTSSQMAIKEYNGSSWDSEKLDQYSIIPLKHSGSIQMYLAKSTGPVYMGVDYGVFGKFRFMTQAAYDALSSYDEDTIYFVRNS